ncbi:protein MIZU-KUSSEI 1-like [Salvia hispanica]|uniref:protein MIZU-KUSSEI 1-like n=1 Tax=Salvia hispanica TaxID=49212 RepID=UPI0020096881|nr:protein MIZU-KUSSEI 1-like [Salvia hispanica]
MRYLEIPANISRASSCESTQSTTNIIPSSFARSTSYVDISDLDYAEELYHRTVVHGGDTPSAAAATAAFRRLDKIRGGRSAVASFLRSLLSVLTFPSCRRPIASPGRLSITPPLGRKVTGTLFGRRRGNVSFAVQYDPRSVPVFLVEFAVSTAALVKEMSAGMLRIALECEKPPRRSGSRLFGEPVWKMYCNGRQCGHAQVRECNESDWHVLSTVQRVSVGAGVIPVVEDKAAEKGELVYMRGRFERVVGNRDSEAFYMLNPDGNSGPELGIFLLRI